MLSLITLPDPNNVLEQSGLWFQPWFDAFLPWILAGIGILMAFALIAWLVRIFGHAVTGGVHIFKKKQMTDEEKWSYKENMRNRNTTDFS